MQNGSLQVSGGREIAPAINSLLSLPFSLKIATKDFHPPDHVSFATSHSAPNNRPFESTVTITNPSSPFESRHVPIWPVHCVQETKGAEIIPELDFRKLEKIIEKGRDRTVEMFSGFADCFGNKPKSAEIDLTTLLEEAAISHIYVVGIAGDYCVRCTAIDARREGYEVYVIDEATKSVDSGEDGWGAAKKELRQSGVKIVSIRDQEVERVKSLA